MSFQSFAYFLILNLLIKRNKGGLYMLFSAAKGTFKDKGNIKKHIFKKIDLHLSHPGYFYR